MSPRNDMVALLSPSLTKSTRRRKAAPLVRSLPATLLTKRISALHRRLIDPASDVETVKAAKQALLRLLSDPLMLPVITTPPMEMAVRRGADVTRKSTEAPRLCEICDRPLPTQPRTSSRRARKATTRSGGFDSFRSLHRNRGARHPLSVRAISDMPRWSPQSLS